MNEGSPRQLAEVREDIDVVDDRLIELLNRRASLAIEIGKLKSKGDKPFFTPERERQVFEAVAAKNHGPLSNRQLVGIFREIVSAARAAEKPLSVAFWGPEGSYSHLAGLQSFGTSSDFVPVDSIASVFRSVENGACDYGVAPIENSIAGVVPETLDMFPLTNVKICAEAYLDIRHVLASNAGQLASVRRVYAGPQPFAQCRRWLQEHLPGVEVVEIVPTSLAAKRASEDDEGAAIANRHGAELAGLQVLAEGIEDHAHNRTRFVVVGFNEPARTGRDKTSLIFNLRNRPGELYRTLGLFEKHGVNLSMIESRPAPRASFEYLFFCDFEGHRADENVAQMIDELKRQALEAIWLGSYPVAG